MWYSLELYRYTAVDWAEVRSAVEAQQEVTFFFCFCTFLTVTAVFSCHGCIGRRTVVRAAQKWEVV